MNYSEATRKAAGMLHGKKKPKKAHRKGGHSAAHPGFKAVQQKIAGRLGGGPDAMERAGAILANSSRMASASAKKKNPRLRRVK